MDRVSHQKSDFSSHSNNVNNVPKYKLYLIFTFEKFKCSCEFFLVKAIRIGGNIKP